MSETTPIPPERVGDELLPCPFCGAPAFNGEDSGDHGSSFVECSADCPMNVRAQRSTFAEAVALWNTRAPAPRSSHADAGGEVASVDHHAYRVAHIACPQFIADPCGSSKCAGCGKRRHEHKPALTPTEPAVRSEGEPLERKVERLQHAVRERADIAKGMVARLNALQSSAGNAIDVFGELLSILKKEAPGTKLNNHRFDQLGINAYAAIAALERALDVTAAPVAPRVGMVDDAMVDRAHAVIRKSFETESWEYGPPSMTARRALLAALEPNNG